MSLYIDRALFVAFDCVLYFEILCVFSVNVHMPKDRITQTHQGYGFVEFMGEDDADYAIKIMNMIKLYGKPIRVNKVSRQLANYLIMKLMKVF